MRDVCLTDDHIYCVMQTERHILECLNESSTGWFYFGGSFAVAHEKASFLPKAINFLHLENWFNKWASERLHSGDYAPLVGTRNSDRRRASTWAHPADPLISHYRRFPGVRSLILELIGISEEAFSERADQIAAGKEQKAAQQIAEDKANAFELARSQVLDCAENKTKLIEIAHQHGVEVKKSWRREEIILAFQAYPEVCQQVIGLEVEEKINSGGVCPQK